MRLRIGLVAVAVGMLVGTGIPTQGQFAECAASDGQKGLDRKEIRLAAESQRSKCEVAQVNIPPHLAETEGGPPLKVQDGEHVVGTASLGGKQFQLKMLVSKGR